jgi:hypothetical protein
MIGLTPSEPFLFLYEETAVPDTPSVIHVYKRHALNAISGTAAEPDITGISS